MNRLQSVLCRSTSGGAWLREIDGLRFIAILAVVLQHFLERFARAQAGHVPQPIGDDPFAFFISRGTVGVFLFFAISGFILALPFAKQQQGGRRVELRDYYFRRLTRIEPPYLIWMSIFALVLVVKGSYSLPDLLPHLAASLSYTHGIFYGSYSPVNPVAWSLEVEIQFYLLAPFLATAYFSIKNRRFRRLGLIAFLAGWMVLQSAFNWWFFPWKLSLLGHLQHFLIGFLLADFYLNEWQKPFKSSWWWDVAAVAGYVGMCYTWTTELWKNLAFAGFMALLMAAAFRGRLFRQLLQNTWIALAGGMCYTIYLTHLPLLEALTPLFKNLRPSADWSVNFGFQLALVLPVIWITGSLFFVLLEKPFMKKFNINSPFKKRSSTSNTSNNMSFSKIIKRSGLFLLLILTNSLFAQRNDSLRLHSLDTIVKRAVQNAPEIKANATDYAKQNLKVEVVRKGWSELITVGSTATVGTGNVTELRTADNISNYAATGRNNAGINISLGLRLSGADFLTRGKKTEMERLQLERLEHEKSMLENDLRDQVTMLYFNLQQALQTFRFRAEEASNLQITLEIAEQYFKAGNLSVNDYAAMRTQYTTAKDNLSRAENDIRLQANLLRNRCRCEVFQPFKK